MAKTPVQIYSLTSGKLDREMRTRMDLKAWFSGCLELLNMIPRQLGAVSRRPGMAFVAEISTAAVGHRMTHFEDKEGGQYLFVFLDGELGIFKGDALVHTKTMPYTAAQLPDLDWDNKGDAMLLVHQDVVYKQLQRQGDDVTWALTDIAPTNIPTYKFDGTNAEAIWSATRGYPGSVFLHQGRCLFGGPKSRPNRIDASKSGELFDFGTTVDLLEDEAASAELTGGSLNLVRSLFGASDLFVLTSGGTFVQPTAESYITPQNFVPKKYGAIPASKSRPEVVNDHVVFVSDAVLDVSQPMHASLVELAWDDGTQSWYPQDLALRCPSLMRAPGPFSVRNTGQQDAAPQVFVVNGDDGSLAMLTPNRFEKVTAWAEWATAGEFLDTACVGNTVYFLIRRTIDGVDRYFIERLAPDRKLDSSLKLSSVTAKTEWDVPHLEGCEVGILADGHLQARKIVTGGKVTLDEAAFEVEIGLPFSWKLVPMPIEAQLADGTLIGHKFRTPLITVAVEDTGELWVDGIRQTFRRLGETLLDQALPLFSGNHSMRRLGWKKGGEAVITLEGHDPLPATILSITVEVAQ